MTDVTTEVTTAGDFSEETVARAKEIIARYPHSRSALLPMLHLVQSEEGYVSPRGVAFCAETLGLTKAQVGAVATFYTMYKRRPAGDWLVSVCTNTMCGVLGGDRAFEALSEYLGVKHNETTEDGAITLEHAECLAACDYGPVMTVNYEYFDQMDAGKALDVVRRLTDGERPAPSRGARLCTFKEMSLQLAGWDDDRKGALADGPAAEPTLAGNRLAAAHGISVAGFDPTTPIASPQASDPIGQQPSAPVAETELAAEAGPGDEQPYGEGSARAAADGSGPEGFQIKGNENSFLYHAPESPHYARTKPEIWFRTAADAEAAGFTSWNAPAEARAEAKARAKEWKQGKGGGR
ncbi:MAG: NADH-quinone oxidoreductase subunit NuoE [Micromonosporaceae bacterium]|nr:NADH-quinone oxidoreductase subunit NuoE [Micromonosporaceae bacterium]